jgi:hypothetical protein
MIWSETAPMKERIRFLGDHHRGLFQFTDILSLSLMVAAVRCLACQSLDSICH